MVLGMPPARLLSAAFVITFVLGFGWGKAAGVPWRVDSPVGTERVAGPSTTTSAVPATVAPTTPVSTTPVSTTAVSTTLPRGGRIPTPADPLRVVMAGDSVMAGLSPAVKAALESGGAAQVRFVLTPSILRDATVRFIWEQQLEQFDPDVIVMFVGTWESRAVEDAAGESLTLGDPRWRSSYENQVVDPWVRLISSKGARVVWIGNAAAVNPEANMVFAGLNTVYASLPERFPQVSYLDSSAALQGESRAFTPVTVDGAGELVRTRQVDGLHLCPDGARLLGAKVVDALVADWAVPVGDGWQDAQASWRSSDTLYPPDHCPPVA